MEYCKIMARFTHLILVTGFADLSSINPSNVDVITLVGLARTVTSENITQTETTSGVMSANDTNTTHTPTVTHILSTNNPTEEYEDAGTATTVLFYIIVLLLG